jgi:hypothetical protein
MDYLKSDYSKDCCEVERSLTIFREVYKNNFICRLFIVLSAYESHSYGLQDIQPGLHVLGA